MGTVVTYTCDCCLKEVKGLATLKDNLAAPHIKELCENCLAALEKHMKPTYERHEQELKDEAAGFLVDRRAELT